MQASSSSPGDPVSGAPVSGDRPARTFTPRLPGAGMDRKVARSRGRIWRGRAIKGGAALGVLLLAYAGWRMVPASGTLAVSADQVTIDPVASAPFQDYLPVRASVAPLKVVFIASVQGGEISSVDVQDGAMVKAGEILAHLGNPQLQLDVSSRESSIASQLGSVSAARLQLQQTVTSEDTQLSEARYSLLKAQRDLGVRQHLHDEGFESDANVHAFEQEAQYYQQRVATLTSARARDQEVARAQGAEIDQESQRLRDNLRDVENTLDALVLRAPVAGRLTNFQPEPGQAIKPGDSVGQVDSEGQWRLDADIDEFYLSRIVVGEKAVAQIGDQSITLTVSRVRPQVTNGQFRAEMVFDKPPPAGLRRGESIDARVTLGETRQALVLPNGAWLEASGGTSAFVVGPDGKSANRVEITSGRRNPEQVEVTQGLHAGDRVVTSSYNNFKNFNHLVLR